MKNPFRFQKLHVFTNDYEWFIAFDSDDAVKAWEEWTGDKWDDSFDPFYRLSDWKNLSVGCELEDFEQIKKESPLFSSNYVKGNFGYIRARNWQWVLNHGRGFLCSTEW